MSARAHTDDDLGPLVILAPFGDDARVLHDIIATADKDVALDIRCGDHQAAPSAPGMLLLTEEALGAATADRLAAFLASEPAWSAPPIIVLCGFETDTAALVAPLRATRPDLPLTLLRRPCMEADIIVAVRTAREIRRAQVGLRDVLARQKQSEHHARFLLNELSHRTKNLFSMILALASQTVRQTHEAPEDFLPTFEGRIHTLANAYAALTRQDWQGATLTDLVEHVVHPLAHLPTGANRVSASGPAVATPPATATTIALALHELSVNACKYGALSNDSGTVSITWTRAPGGDAVLEWREQGGPTVKPPSHKGFGTRVITDAIRSEAGGKAEMTFAPEGLTVVLRFQTTETAPPAQDPD